MCSEIRREKVSQCESALSVHNVNGTNKPTKVTFIVVIIFVNILDISHSYQKKNYRICNIYARLISCLTLLRTSSTRKVSLQNFLQYSLCCKTVTSSNGSIIFRFPVLTPILKDRGIFNPNLSKLVHVIFVLFFKSLLSFSRKTQDAILEMPADKIIIC